MTTVLDPEQLIRLIPGHTGAGLTGCSYVPDYQVVPWVLCYEPTVYALTSPKVDAPPPDGLFHVCAAHAAWVRATHPELVAEIRSVEASW